MNRIWKALGGFMLATALVACGGGGGSPGTTPGTNTGGTTTTGNTGGTTTTTTPGTTTTTTSVSPVVASLDVFTSAAELSTAAGSTISFTVVPKDASNQAIPSQTVTFAATSGSLTGALPPPATGANGTPVTGVSLAPGADRSNRDITVTVTSGGVTKQVVVPVTGTALTLTGDSFVQQSSATTFTAKAVDSAGVAISGATLTATSALGNTLSPASLTTNSQGIATFTYTGVKAGNDVVTVSGLGSSAKANIAISADEFRFTAPSANATVDVNTNQTVVVTFLQGGVPVAGRTVVFSTTRGTIAPTSVVTNAQGQASATVSSSSAGPANIVAQTGTSQVTLPLNFVAVTPTTLNLQANPSAVPPNANGSTSSQATLLATVRDASGNPVQGKIVAFTATKDPSSGSISPGTAVTDASGTATSIFLPGAITTANNGVEITATVQGTGVLGTTSLTVNSAAVFISISTGNEISNLDPTTYRKDFAVQVVDVNGAPVANKVVSLSVVPDEYLKGTLSFNGKIWTYSGNPPSPSATCVNEDKNRNGVLDAGEDVNGNAKLDPGNPVTISASAVTTGANGIATFSLFYGENFAPWLNVVITATTTVGGTEAVKTQDYFLKGSTGDFNNETSPPAGVVSPFGVGTTCTDPN